MISACVSNFLERAMTASSVGFELEVGTSDAEPAVRTDPGKNG